MGQVFRLVDHIKVAAVFQGVGCGSAQILCGAAIRLPGQGCGAAGKSPGKIGRIGYADVKRTRRKQVGKLAQVRAYTFHTCRQGIGADIVQGGGMGLRIQLDPGDPASAVAGAKQQSQGAAAGAEIQHPGILRQPREMRKHHGIRTEREAAPGNIQDIAIGKMFHGSLRIQNWPARGCVQVNRGFNKNQPSSMASVGH